MKIITRFLLFQLLLSFVPTGLEAQDVPTTNITTLVGNYQQVQSGISFYPTITDNTFMVDLPACSGGAAPTIAYAYLSWQGRFRDATDEILATGPNFDQNLNVQINTSAVTDIAASFFPVGSAEQVPTTRWHFTGFADVTTFVQANITAGSNTIAITDFDRPSQIGGSNYNQNFGVSLTIVYECPEFSLSTITVGAGADFFFCGTPAGEVGDYSELTVFEFPATATEINGSLKGTFGGQANTAAPFRGGNICYVIGSGTPPAATRTNDLPDPVVINAPTVICTDNPILVSALGTEWDTLNVPITIPAGSTYLAIQAQSADDPGGNSASCGSLITSTFSLEVSGNLFAPLCTDPTASAFAIQPSCVEDEVEPNTGYLQISAATDASHYNFVMGDDYEDDGGDTDIANATAFDPTTDLPLTFGNLPNPSGTQDYTIRIFNDAATDCFVDVTVTMNEQDCTIGCDCKEVIYLNEPAIGAVLKFEIGPDLLLTEVTGANGGTPPNEHWYPGTGTSELRSPHGLAFDLNGNIYIGSDFAVNTPIRKFDCDGNLAPIDGNTVNNDYILTNIFSIGNTLYATRNDGPASYDLCTGDPIGTMCLNDAAGVPLSSNNQSTAFTNWGLNYNRDLDLVYVTGSQVFKQGFWVFTRAELEAAIGAGPPCVDQLISRNAAVAYADLAVGDNFLPNNIGQLNGITSDNSGNIYVAGWLTGTGSPGFVLKYDPTGGFLAATAPNPGMAVTRGVVWSETTNRIYVSNQTDSPAVDCISAFDPADLSYLGAAAPNPNIAQNNSGKAMAILKECCPTNNNQVLEVVACSPTALDPVFLNELFPCDGVLCDGAWIPADALSASVYDDCNQSIMAGTDPGCYSYTRSSDGTGANSACGAFVQSFTIAIGQLMPSFLGGDQQICRGVDPEPFTIETAATGSDDLSFQWYVSSESATTGFTPIDGATTEVYDPTAADIVADTMYFRNEVSITTCTGEMCTDISNTVVVITIVDVTLDAGDDATVCSTASTIDLTTASITPADFMAMDGTLLGATWTSSGTGMFFDAGGALLPAPVRLGEAISYQLSAADITDGAVTLTLTSDDLSALPFEVAGCVPVLDELTITILEVDCGVFPWEGND